MSTRKLIVVALLAGLAILLAGGIQLVVLAGKDEGTSNPTRELLALGEGADLDGVSVTALGVRRAGDLVVLEVGFTRGDGDDGGDGGALAELGRGWALFSPDADLVERTDLPAGATPCGGAAAPTSAAGEQRCDVAFALGDDPMAGTYLASFRGERSWRVPLPAT